MSAVTRPRVVNVRPGDLVLRAEQGRIRIPRFQRSFRWETEDVIRLFDSIFRGYPVGNLLMWQRPAPAGTINLGAMRLDVPPAADAWWVVDGQQRVASIVGALIAPVDAVDPRLRIFFDLRSPAFVSAGRRHTVPEYWLPLRVARSNADTLAWQRNRDLDPEQIALSDQVVTALRDFEIPAYVVESDDEQALRDIFDRLNNYGKRLKSAEVFNALHAVAPEREPSDLDSLAETVRGLGFGDIDRQVLFRCVMASRDGDVTRDFRREFQSESDRHQAFKSTGDALTHVVSFLQNVADIPHIRLLPYALALPVLTRFVVKFGPPRAPNDELLRRWIWRGAATGVQIDGFTAALRHTAAAIYSDPASSAHRLLDILADDGTRWVPDLNAVRFSSSAAARLNLLAMASARPRVLLPVDAHEVDDLVDLPGLLTDRAHALVRYVAGGASGGNSLPGRLVHPEARERDLVQAISIASDEALASHFMDKRDAWLLQHNQVDTVLAHRAKRLTDHIAMYVARRAKWSFHDRPIVSLFDDDEDYADAG